MRIESGSTRERIIRNLLMLIMIAVFAVWFAYDGLVGYPEKNRQEHLQQLTEEERATVKDLPLYETVRPEALPKVKDLVRNSTPSNVRSEVEAFFGGPPSFESKEAWFYFGPTFRIQMNLRNGHPWLGRGGNQILGAAADKSELDIMIQRGFSIVLGLLAVYLLFFVVRVARTRLVLDEDGLTYNGKGPIRWDDMKALDISRFTAKGWVNLVYASGDQEQTLRLDEYHIAAFDQVIDEVCSRKGFENPLPVQGEESSKEESASDSQD